MKEKQRKLFELRSLGIILLLVFLCGTILSVQGKTAKASSGTNYPDSDTVFLYGIITYRDYNIAETEWEPQPIRYAYLEIWMKADDNPYKWRIALLWTDENGYFEFEYSISVTRYYFFELHSGTNKWIELVDLNGYDYIYTSEMIEVAPGSSADFSTTINGSEWNVLDSAVEARLWITQKTGWAPGMTHIFFPCECDISHSSGGNIYFQELDEWSDNTMYHEYSHVIMYNLYGWYPQTEPECKKHYASKVTGLKCAFTEGWAEFLADAIGGGAMGNSYCDWDTTSTKSSIELEYAYNYIGPYEPAKDFKDMFNPDAGDKAKVEGNVAGILWDIFDAAYTNDHYYPFYCPEVGERVYTDQYDDDGLSMGFNEIWDVMGTWKPETIHEFWDGWFDLGNANTNYRKHWIKAVYYNHGISEAEFPENAPSFNGNIDTNLISINPDFESGTILLSVYPPSVNEDDDEDECFLYFSYEYLFDMNNNWQEDSTNEDWMTIVDWDICVYDPLPSYYWDTTEVSDGQYILRARLHDDMEEDFTQLVYLKIDNTLPITYHSLSPENPNGENGWYTSDVGIKFIRSDSYSGVDYVTYSINNGPWETIPGEGTQALCDPALDPSGCDIILSSDDVFDIRYYSVDFAGNSEAIHYLQIKIDKSVPDTPSISESHTGAGWSNHNTPYLTFYSNDATSYICYYQGKIDSGSWSNKTSPWHIDNPPLDDGVHTIYIKAVNCAGLTAQSSITVYIDTTPPTNPNSYSSSHTINVWSGDNTIYVEWSGAWDAHSGVFGYSYVWDQNPSTIPDSIVETQGTSSTSNPLGSGDWYIHIRTRDNAGNWNSGAYHVGPFKIDVTPPSNPNSYDASHIVGEWSNDDTIEIGLYGEYDAHSGVDGFSILWDQSSSTIPDETMDTAIPWAESPSLDTGLWYFHIRTVDNVGNWNSGAFHVGPFKIDVTPPVTTLISPPDDHWTNDNTPEFEWTADDGDGSGVDFYWFQLSSSSNFDQFITSIFIFTNSYTQTEPLDDGTYYWRVITIDNAGNWDEWKAENTWIINIDTVPPKAPRSLTASFTNENGPSVISNIYLYWALSEDDGGGYDDVIYYEIYRSSIVDGTYYLHAAAQKGSGFYIDMGAGKSNPNNYFYKIMAVDRARNSGMIEELKAGKYIIQLYRGNNFISLPLVQKDTSIDSVLMSINDNNYDHVWWLNPADGITYEWIPGSSYYQLTNIDHRMSFWIHVIPLQDTLVVVGSVPIYPAIKLYLGENWIGYPSFLSNHVFECFKNVDYGALYTFNNQFKYIDPMGPYDSFIPGQGYSITITSITDHFDIASASNVIYGNELTPLDRSYLNDGNNYIIKTVADFGMEPPQVLKVIYEFPLSLKGEIWTYYIDAFFIRCPNCLGGPFTISYQNPLDGSWVYMLSITDDWINDPSGTIPTHKFEFPKGLFNGVSSAYIEIDYSCPWDPLYGCVDTLYIDQMFIHTKSTGVWHILSQQSDIKFSSLDITFSNEFSQLSVEIIIDAMIYNTGDSNMEDITISFYEIMNDFTLITNQYGWIIGQSNLQFLTLIKRETFDIEAQSSYLASTTWSPGGGLQKPRILIVIDYNSDEKDGYIAEGYGEIILV